MPIDTKGFIDLCWSLNTRQAQMFVRIHNAPNGLTRQELAEALLILRLGPVQYVALNELQAAGLIDYTDSRYTVTPLAKQLVREIQQNQKLARHLQPAPPRKDNSRSVAITGTL